MSQTNTETNSKGGPRTAEGKAASSRNSFKHGLASGQILIEGEDPDAFDSLVADLEADYQPATETEALLVHDLAKFHWLADRAIRLQALAFASAAFASAVPEIPASLNVLIRYQTTNQRAFQTTLKSLQVLQKEREKAERASSPPSEQTEARSKTQRTSSPPSEQTEARSKTQRTKFVSQEPAEAPEYDEDFTSGPPEGWFDGMELQRRYYAEMNAKEAEEKKQATERYIAKLRAENPELYPLPETTTQG
jgi:hypothetical protein